MKKAKRILPFLLSVLMLFTLIPMTAFAEGDGTDSSTTNTDQIGNYYEDSGTDLKENSAINENHSNTKTYSGNENVYVKVDKTIQATDKENVFDITLNVETTEDTKAVEQVPPSAIVLVMDISLSMNYNLQGKNTNTNSQKRITLARKAAKDFIDSYKKACQEKKTDGKIAIVTFGEKATISHNWTDVTTTNINTDQIGQSLEAGTNIEAGLKLAKDLVDDNSVANISNKNIVLLSDGRPNCYAGDYSKDKKTINKAGGHTTGSDGNNTYHADHAKVETLATNIKNAGKYAIYFADDTNAGMSNYITCVGAYRDISGDQKCNLSKPVGTWLDDDCGFSAWNAASAEALKEAFAAIQSSITSYANTWRVTDPMGEHIVWNGTAEEPAHYTFSNNTLDWDLTKVTPKFEGNVKKYEMTYQVKLDNLFDGFDENDKFPTNGRTKLEYAFSQKIGDDDYPGPHDDLYFNVPSVKGFAGELKFDKVDDKGNVVNGAVFTLSTTDGWEKTATSQNGKVTFSDIPSGHRYTLTETTVPDEYDDTKVDEYTFDVSYGKVTNSNLPSNNKVVNCLKVTEPEYISVPVMKVWEDNDNAANARPDSVTIVLKQEGYTDKEVTLNENNGWKDKFTDVVKDLPFTLEEKEVPANYKVTIPTESSQIQTSEGKAPVAGAEVNLGRATSCTDHLFSGHIFEFKGNIVVFKFDGKYHIWAHGCNSEGVSKPAIIDAINAKLGTDIPNTTDIDDGAFFEYWTIPAIHGIHLDNYLKTIDFDTPSKGDKFWVGTWNPTSTDGTEPSYEDRWVITNTYVEPETYVTAPIQAVKRVNGEKTENATQFEFELCDSDGKVIQKNFADTNGDIVFFVTNLYPQAEPYHYILKEVNNHIVGYTYDETVWDVYVKVDEEMNESTGMHQYTVTYRNQYDECDPYEDHPVFNNIYVAPEEPGTLTVSKVVTGNKAPATPINYEFELTLPQEMTFTANGEEVTAENGVYQFTLAGGEQITFEGLPLDTVYTVKEVSTGDFTTTVSINEDEPSANTVVTSSSNYDVRLVYTNAYGDHTNPPVDPPVGPSGPNISNTTDTLPLDINVQKYFNGSEWVLTPYTFMIQNTLNPGNRYPDRTMQNNTSGWADFEPYYLGQPGEYEFKVTEVAGDDQNVVYDNSVYTVRVTVTAGNPQTTSGDGWIHTHTSLHISRIDWYKNGELVHQYDSKYTPAFYNTTVKPEEPEVPVDPENPEEPEEPENPDVEEPETPVDPENPEEPETPDVEEPDVEQPVDHVPQTGDTSNMTLWIVLAAISALGAGAVLFAKKRLTGRK